MQDYTNNPFVGQKVIQELIIGSRKNLNYNPQKYPLQIIYQLENMDYMMYEIVERLKDKEPVIRQILKEQNDIDYLMDMHQEYYTNENKRENSLVYKLQNQYLSDIETQRIMSNIPVCPGNIIELDTNEYQLLQLSPVMYLISVDWANTNQNFIKEHFTRWTPIIPYNSNLYVAMYSPNTVKIQENKTIHQKQLLNVYNHRYITNYKYSNYVKDNQRQVYLSYNGQLYKLEYQESIVGEQKILSKLVKDFSNLPILTDIKTYDEHNPQQPQALIDNQTEYFDTNQDYLFNIRQYSFTNSKGNVFIIQPPINNIVQNIYLYSCNDDSLQD